MKIQTVDGSRLGPATGDALACPAPFSVGRGAAGFWLASLAGFALHGWILARSAAGAWAEPSGGSGLAEGLGTALTLGLLEAVVLGAPAALLFAAIMRRSRSPAWPAALALGGAMSVGLSFVLASCAWAAVDLGWARVPGVHLAAATAAVTAGAVAGMVSGRGRGSSRDSASRGS